MFFYCFYHSWWIKIIIIEPIHPDASGVGFVPSVGGPRQLLLCRRWIRSTCCTCCCRPAWRRRMHSCCPWQRRPTPSPSHTDDCEYWTWSVPVVTSSWSISLLKLRAGFKGGGARRPGPQAFHQQGASHQTLQIFFVRDVCAWLRVIQRLRYYWLLITVFL